MASSTPTNDTPAPVVAPKAEIVAPVAKTPPITAPKADPAPAKVELKPVEAVKSVAEKVVAAVARPVEAVVAAVTKPTAKPVSAKAVTPPAKKKAVAKPAPKTPASKTGAPKIVKTIKPAVAPAIAKAKAVVTKEVTIMEAQIKNAADKAKTMLNDANAKGTKAFGEMNDFAKGNIEAIVESGKIAAKGMESMGQDTAEFARKQFESATAALKSLSTVKSPTDFFKLQGDYVRTYFDSMVAHSSKSTEKMLKLAGEVAQPIQNRVSVAVEKVKIAA